MPGPDYHGWTHDKDGTDPIPGADGFIRFDYDNQGGYLEVTTNDSNNYSGIGDLGVYFDDESGQGILFDLHDPSLVGRIALTGASIALIHEDAIFVGVTGGPSVEVNSTNVIVNLTSGTVLEVQDNAGNPIFRVDEDGDLHGKTGKALTFDL